jgi:ABC-type multidrug transport system fused ATPase/permease subunit
LVAIFAFRGLMNFGQSYLNDYVGLRIINDVRNQLNRHFQSLSVSFFHRQSKRNAPVSRQQRCSLVRYVNHRCAGFFFEGLHFARGFDGGGIFERLGPGVDRFFVFPASVLRSCGSAKKSKDSLGAAKSALGC